MFNEMLDYIKNNQQEIIIYLVLSLLAVIFLVGIIIWINKYLYRKHHDFGCKHFELEEFDKAIQEFNIAVKFARKTLSGKKSDVENTSFLLAQAYIASSNWEQAIAALTECIGISPNKTKYHIHLVENYLREERPYQARESLDKAFSLVSIDAINEIREKKIHAMMRDTKNPEIAEKLSGLKTPMAVSESEELDKLEILKPDFEGRRFILEGLAGDEPSSLNLAKLYIRQYILEKNGFMDESRDLEEEEGKEQKEEEQKKDSHRIPYLTKAREALEMLEVNAESAEFYNALAFLSVQKEDAKAAEENYERAIMYNPQYADTYYNLALLCLDKLNDPERAIENFRNAIERDAELAKAHHNLALLLLGSGGNTVEAKHHLSEAIRINPIFSEVYWDLALILAKKEYKEFLLG
uniref:Tetratricopeptide repeat-containing protein n=1 Tax=Candidatus Kentrum sp. FW TaxID=2126338 RepID=A0A450THG1_9GAMM|nr:MAG: Tetratricopeptide repeat-containing protein [Candidatus Kentron sp. FW]